MSYPVGLNFFHNYFTPGINSPQSEAIRATVTELELKLSEKESYHLDAMWLDWEPGLKELEAEWNERELLVKNKIRALAKDVRDKLKEMQVSNCNVKELKTEFNKLFEEFDRSSEFFVARTRGKFLYDKRMVNERSEALADKVKKATLNNRPIRSSKIKVDSTAAVPASNKTALSSDGCGNSFRIPISPVLSGDPDSPYTVFDAMGDRRN